MSTESTLTIDDSTHAVRPECIHNEEHKKVQIILAESLRAGSNNLVRLKNKDFGKTSTYPTFTISRSGMVYQHYNPKYYTDFIGIPEIDQKSISIVLENMGKLFYHDDNELYVNWCNETCPSDRVFHKNWKEFSYWEQYTPEQINATIALCKKLVKEFDIVNDCIGWNFYNDETKYFEGIVCRGNYSYDFCDLNPSFDFKDFMFRMEISLTE